MIFFWNDPDFKQPVDNLDVDGAVVPAALHPVEGGPGATNCRRLQITPAREQQIHKFVKDNGINDLC